MRSPGIYLAQAADGEKPHPYNGFSGKKLVLIQIVCMPNTTWDGDLCQSVYCPHP